MRKRQKYLGFSLVELMIAVAMVAILALAAAPLGRAWVMNSKMDNTANNFKEAYAFARALAIENRNSQTGSTPSAYLEIKDNVIQVYSDTSNVLWQRGVDTDVIVEYQVEDSCTNNRLELTNLGLPVDADCLSYSITGTGISDAYAFSLQ